MVPIINPTVVPITTSDFSSIRAFDKLRLTPYINSGINDCAVWERGSLHTANRLAV
uniref:Protein DETOXIFICATION Multidrug and toxic compound extrusion protein n=1 Tax=Rhizophora mucronata TaxID=61149 RepID=A0A2P2L1U9_RHIMU